MELRHLKKQHLTRVQFSQQFYVTVAIIATLQMKQGTKKLDNLPKDTACKWQTGRVLRAGSIVLVQYVRTRIQKKLWKSRFQISEHFLQLSNYMFLMKKSF